MAEGPASGIDGNRQQDGVTDNRKAAHDPAAIYEALSGACIDRAVLRHGTVERRTRPRLDSQPGGLFSPLRSRARAQTAHREYHGRAYGGRRLLRAQCRRRCRARRRLAGEGGQRPAGPRAMVARGRDVARAVRCGDGDRDRGRSRRARRDRRMASLDLEQWPHRAAGRGDDPVAFRLRHLSDSRARDVIKSVAKRANWKPDKQAGVGYGLGFARYKNTGAYCAVVAEIEGAEDIRVKRLTIAVDV